MQGGIGLDCSQLIERAMEGAFKASVVAREAIVAGIEHADFSFEDADQAEVPDGGEELVE